MARDFYARQKNDRPTEQQKPRAGEMRGKDDASEKEKIAEAREAGRRIREERARKRAPAPFPTGEEFEPDRDPFNPGLRGKIMEAQAGFSGAAKQRAIWARSILDDKKASAAQKQEARDIISRYNNSVTQWQRQLSVRRDLWRAEYYAEHPEEDLSRSGGGGGGVGWAGACGCGGGGG